MIFIIILFSFLILSVFTNNRKINYNALCLTIYFMIKWLTNYRKCTISYLECKVRGVKKEQGFLYNILEEIFDLNKKDFKYLVYLFTIIIMWINYNKIYS
jgi:hypothetical protein